MVIRLTRFDSSEPNSAIAFAGEVVSAYSLTSVIETPLIRSTCCPVRPENNIIFITEVRCKGSPSIQILATHYITRILQLILPMILLYFVVHGSYLFGSFMFCMHVHTEIVSKLWCCIWSTHKWQLILFPIFLNSVNVTAETQTFFYGCSCTWNPCSNIRLIIP
jgi:hypothetical protein